MNKQKSFEILLSPPHLGGRELEFIQQAFQENWVSTDGPNVKNFEAELESYLGKNNYVAALVTGTSAIDLALELLDINSGDYVIVQSLTFIGSVSPVVHRGAVPVFVDSEEDTWNMCPVALEDAVKACVAKGHKPKAIIAVELFGMPFKVDEILAVCNKYGIPLIEDSAEALGSSYKGQRCGTFGDFSILSFNGNKIITTSGGGALVCRTPEQKHRTVFFATQARDHAVYYQHSSVGFNYRMSNITAGIGRGQMEVLNERVRQRTANHRFYQEIFEDIPGVEVFTVPSPEYISNNWLTAIRFTEPMEGRTAPDLCRCLHDLNI